MVRRDPAPRKRGKSKGRRKRGRRRKKKKYEDTSASLQGGSATEEVFSSENATLQRAKTPLDAFARESRSRTDELRKMLNTREISRDRLLVLLEWEQAMEAERAKITSSFYWSVMTEEERGRLEKIFREEREETNRLVNDLLDDYKPSMLRKRRRGRSRRRRGGGRKRGGAEAGSSSVPVLPSPTSPAAAAAKLSSGVADYKYKRSEWDVPTGFYRYGDGLGANKQDTSIPSARPGKINFEYYINEIDSKVQAPSEQAASLEIVRQKKRDGTVTHVPNIIHREKSRGSILTRKMRKREENKRLRRRLDVDSGSRSTEMKGDHSIQQDILNKRRTLDHIRPRTTNTMSVTFADEFEANVRALNHAKYEAERRAAMGSRGGTRPSTRGSLVGTPGSSSRRMLRRLDENTKKPASLGTLLHEFGSPADRRMEEQQERKARARGDASGTGGSGVADGSQISDSAPRESSSLEKRRRLAVRGTVFGVDEVELKLCIWETCPEPGQPLFLSPFVFTIVAEDEESESTYECEITSNEIPVFWAPSEDRVGDGEESKNKDFMNEPLAHALFSCLRLIDHPSKGKLFFIDKHRFAKMTKSKAKEHFSNRSGKARAGTQKRRSVGTSKGAMQTRAHSEQSQAAVCIQAAVRGRISRRKVKRARKEQRRNGAQRRRGRRGRGRDKVKAEFTPAGAATKVQSLYRGTRDRKLFRARREKRRGGNRTEGRRRKIEENAQNRSGNEAFVVKAQAVARGWSNRRVPRWKHAQAAAAGAAVSTETKIAWVRDEFPDLFKRWRGTLSDKDVCAAILRSKKKRGKVDLVFAQELLQNRLLRMQRKQQKERLLAAFPEVFEEWGSFFEHDSIVRAFEESATDDRESAEACVELLQKRAVALKAQLDDVSKK